MENSLVYTHELIANQTKIYEKSVLAIENRINADFEKIDSVSLTKWANGQKMLEVKGKVHLYGFKVENGGFFDVINMKYYSEFSELFKNATIIESVNKNKTRTLKPSK